MLIRPLATNAIEVTMERRVNEKAGGTFVVREVDGKLHVHLADYLPAGLEVKVFYEKGEPCEKPYLVELSRIAGGK